MKVYLKKYWYVFLLISILIFSCAVPNRPSDDKDATGNGVLLVNFNASSLANKTITPTLDMTPATYDIAGAGPGGDSFSLLGVSSGQLVDQLTPGSWIISVNAYNAGGTKIGSGSGSVTVTAGATASVVISVTPLDGTGTLDLTLDWSGNTATITNEVVSANLKPAGESASNITFTPGVDLATHSSTQNTGYYTFTAQITFDADGVPGTWNYTSAVRILYNETTSATINFTVGVTQGSLDIGINPEMDDPIVITFSGPDQIEAGTNGTFSATTDPSPVDSYQWYLDYLPIAGATSASVITGNTLAEGDYILTLIVEKDAIVSSEDFSFSVVGEIVAVPPYTFVDAGQVSDWAAVTAGDQQGITAVDHDAVQGNNAAGSMTATCAFTGTQGTVGDNFTKGAVVNAPALPVNVTGKTITASIYVPAGMVTDPAHPYGLQLFIKDSAYNWADGGWNNLGVAGWQTFTWDLEANPPTTAPIPTLTDITEIGVQVAKGSGTPDFSGTIYLDDIDWTGVTIPVVAPPYTFTNASEANDWAVTTAGDQQGFSSVAHDVAFTDNQGGTGSLLVDVNYSTGNYTKGVLSHICDPRLDMTNNTITFNIYIPSDIAASAFYGIQIFVKSGALWTWDDGGVAGWVSPLTAGWNTYTRDLGASLTAGDIEDVVEIGFQITDLHTTPTWSGSIYVDDVNWE